MPKKTIYVRDADQELWERAEQLAGGSLSGLLADALRRYVDEEELKEETNMETIEVRLGGKNFSRDVSFVGEMLVSPGDEIRTAEEGYDAGAYYGVARTKLGNIAVYAAHVNSGFDATLETYSSFEEAVEDGMPADVIAMAQSEADPNYVQPLDI
jgi:hypothetical protein